ncbi:hypothetical protein [Bacillus suaedae]|uniref:O-antigen polymerase n=1 Tax=Halalkalibacter suaedae TaxID=2822140 RepID=A0A941AMT1_9BACI|nr:hypothetical protein [Bacillus suaedae]MBP3950875.1 hypothetical protein [Bacillus suaedae]
MKQENESDFKDEEYTHNSRHIGKGRSHHRGGAKTFRRRRALSFLEMMKVKRATIKQQLEEPEFQSINQILIGELKAIDMVISEFIQLFEIHEDEVKENIEIKKNGESLEKSNEGEEYE